MKFLTLATALSILSAASAKTVFVTQTHITTLYDGQQPTQTQAATQFATTIYESANTYEAKANNDAAQSQDPAPSPSSSTAYTPTTLVTATSAAPSASPSSSSSSDSGIYADISKSPNLDQDFAKSILDAHNQKRAIHSAPELSWDQEVYNYAQAYADKYDCSGTLTHSGGQYGENLAVGYQTGDAALVAWYDEGNNYDYSSASTYDHFTQVVWKSTTKLGCAYKDCSAENWGKYVICSYDPAGNFVGQAKANVLAN